MKRFEGEFGVVELFYCGVDDCGELGVGVVDFGRVLDWFVGG